MAFVFIIPTYCDSSTESLASIYCLKPAGNLSCTQSSKRSGLNVRSQQRAFSLRKGLGDKVRAEASVLILRSLPVGGVPETI